MTETDNRGKAPFLRTPAGIALILFGAIAAFFLVAEHRAHALGVLPFLILLACPLLHLFMHRGHAGHSGPPQTGERAQPPAGRPGSPGGSSGSGGPTT